MRLQQLATDLEQKWKRILTGMKIIAILKDRKGIALFMAIAMMAVFLFFLSASMFLTRIDSKVTSNFKLAAQSLEVADAGLQHALALIATGYDFDGQLSCGTPPCEVVYNPSFPAGSNFSYRVTAENDVANDTTGSATDDENNIILLTSKAEGPAATTKTVSAYVRRSLNQFKPPSAVYVNGTSASPHDSYFFDNDNSVVIVGDDTNPGNIQDPWDDSAGSESSITAVAATSAAVTNALLNEHSTWGHLHYFQGEGGDPSIGTTFDVIDVEAVAQNFINQGSTVKYLNGLVTDSSCSSPCQVCSSGSPCNFGTVASPQITYIKDSTTSSTVLDGYVNGYGVLVVEGRTTIGGNFRFNGLVIHKKAASDHYVSFEENAWVYGGVLFGSYDDNVKFTIEDYSRIFYSSQALGMVDSHWGMLLPRPARVFGWLDK